MPTYLSTGYCNDDSDKNEGDGGDGGVVSLVAVQLLAARRQRWRRQHAVAATVEIPPLEVPVWAPLAVLASGDGEAGRMEAPVIAMIRTCHVDWQWLRPGRCLWEAPHS